MVVSFLGLFNLLFLFLIWIQPGERNWLEDFFPLSPSAFWEMYVPIVLFMQAVHARTHEILKGKNSFTFEDCSFYILCFFKMYSLFRFLFLVRLN